MQEGATTEDPSIHHDVPVKQCQIRIIPVDAVVKESDGKIKAEDEQTPMLKESHGRGRCQNEDAVMENDVIGRRKGKKKVEKKVQPRRTSHCQYLITPAQCNILFTVMSSSGRVSYSSSKPSLLDLTRFGLINFLSR